LEQSTERAERTYIKLSLGFLLGIILLVAVIWGGRDLYLRWQERRLVRLATFDLAHGDERGASLAARAILQSKPDSIAATRIMAELADRLRDKRAVEWRRQAVQLDPHSVVDLIALAKSAVLLNDFTTAEAALNQVPANGKELAEYHVAAALLAQGRHQAETAETEWREAVRIAPNEKDYQLHLGTLQLRSKEASRHGEGERLLEELRASPPQRIAALRALISDGVARRGSAGRLLDLARQLQESPGATLAESIIYLDFLHQLNDPGFVSYLSELEKRAALNPSDLGTLLSWMGQNNLNLLALDYQKTVPREVLQKWPVPLASADVYVQLKEWKQLESAVKSANWGNYDFIRHAYLARALREQDKPAAAEKEWASAAKTASGEIEQTLMLLRTVSEWGWSDEAVDLLWTLSKRPEKQNEALATLYKHYAKTQDTQGLYRVMTRLAELDPENLDVKNNIAQIGLLLNAQADEACRSAAEIHRKAPENPAYTATYAYSLLTKGDAKGAVRVMSSLPDDKLSDPAIGTYYGICLAAIKDERAGMFLAMAEKATLLPEEKALVAKAESALR
jgi:predicted Zn-dependent protease